MNCQEVMELMQRHLDEDLDTQEEMELQDHLRHCQECTEMFERLQRLSQELTQLPKVVPPYSLVDALIPQLGEIDKAAAQAATEPSIVLGRAPHTINKDEGQSPRRKWTRRLESQFSWKFAGGVIAAGLILGFFAFNMKHPVLDNADGLLPPKASKEIASSSTVQHAPAAADATSAANAKRMAINDSPQASAAVTTPSSDAQQQPTTQPAAGGSSQAQGQASPDATVEKPQPLKDAGVDASSPTPKMAPSTSEPARMKGASGKASNEAVPGPTAPAASSPQPGPQGSEQNQAARIQATEPPASSPVAGPQEPKTKTPNTNGVYSLMTQAPVPLKSLTGTYEAVIENHHVVIRNSASREIVYTSAYQGQDSDEVVLSAWSKDDKLTYQVKSGDISKSFVIDVKTKTESST